MARVHEASPNEQLLEAAARGDAAKVVRLLKRTTERECEASTAQGREADGNGGAQENVREDGKAAEAGYQEEEGGESALMRAARGGHVEIIRVLLEAGAPWNAVDRRGRSAGDHAMEAMAELAERQEKGILASSGELAQCTEDKDTANSAGASYEDSNGASAPAPAPALSAEGSRGTAGAPDPKRVKEAEDATSVRDHRDSGMVTDTSASEVAGPPGDETPGSQEGQAEERSVEVLAELINEGFNILLNAGIQAELILGASERRQSASEGAVRNAQYLQERLQFGEGRILDGEQGAVMMQWERALMEAHAQAICQQGGDILNIGFGMGIIDTAIAKRSVLSHTIVEAHPDVLKRMEEEGWTSRDGVTVVRGRWQDVLDQLGTYDGIFFDTYGEHYEDLREFHSHLPQLLRHTGVYSFFNGLCAHSAFFHTVYCQLASLELAHLGLKVDLVPLPVAQCLASDVWEGVRQKYWQLDTYYLPLCYWEDGEKGEEEQEAGRV